jgi:ketosteroid isomerase-like protein
MSRENVDRVKEFFGRFAASGEPAWDALHESIEVHDHDLLDASDYRGHEGFRHWLDDWEAAWTEFNMEPEEFFDAGQRVVMVFRMKATGRTSGLVVERQDSIVWEIRDGKVMRVDYYNSREQGLDAVGLDA